MANAYTQLIIQIVIVVQFREAMVTSDMKDEMEMYISGIIQSHGHKLLAIYCMPDHTHILVGLNPNQSVSELVRLIKANLLSISMSVVFAKGSFSGKKAMGLSVIVFPPYREWPVTSKIKRSIMLERSLRKSTSLS